MADSQNDSWRTENFRQSVRTKIEEAIRQAGNPTTKSVMEMETHVFQKAKSKEEYLQYVARVILHVRDINSKKAAQGMVPGQMGPATSVVPQGGQGADPMSQLRNLASQGGNGTIVTPLGHQMGAPILVTGGPPGGMTQTSQSQMGLSQAGLLPPNSTVAQGMNSLMVQQPRFLSGVVAQMPNQQPQQRIMSPNMQMQVQRLQRQQAPQQMQPGPSPPMVGYVQQQSPAGMQFQGPVPQGPQFAGQNQVCVNVQGQVPPPNQSIASPVHQMVNMSGPPMSASPAGYASPSPQVVPSPIPGYPPRSVMIGAPSPGSTLNTPGPPMPTASPMGRQIPDDQAYLEKLKQLQKYVEPLRRMISRIDKDEGDTKSARVQRKRLTMCFPDKKKEQSRLKGLLDILTDPNKRCPMETLLKCEQVLERLELKVKVSEVMGHKMQEQNLGQPLLDAIAAHIKSPLINHTLQRTFGPVIAALCGPSPRVPSPPPKRKKVEEDNSEISNVLQGEIARLDQRFKVQLDPAHHSGSRTVHLVCQLDDKNLPCVPPISITVPENYPDRPPKCNMNENEYESTPFLQTIKKVFTSHLTCMPDKFSVSLFLDIWEMSVRQSCAPPCATLLDV